MEADLDDLYGATVWSNRTIYVAPGLSGPQWRSTILHELTHLVRGPVPHHQADVEEQAVQDEVARQLVPVGQALSLLDHRWTVAEVSRVAHHYGVTRSVVLAAIDPPTLPLAPVVPSPRAADADEGAA